MQEAISLNQNFHHLPIREVRRDNDRVLISVRLLDREVRAKIWELHVGRVNLYLLDTDIAENNAGRSPDHARSSTAAIWKCGCGRKSCSASAV